MKEVLLLDCADVEIMNNFVNDYRELILKLGFPSLKPCTVRQTTQNGLFVTVNFDVQGNGRLRIRVKGETSPLLVTQHFFEPFELVADLTNGNIIKAPSSRKIIDWLNTQYDEDHTNFQTLLATYIAGDFILNFMRPLTQERIVNDVKEVRLVNCYDKKVREEVKRQLLEYKKAHITDGWDVVNLTSKQLCLLGDRVHNLDKFEYENVALQKFCLALYNDAHKHMQYWYFQREGDVLTCALDAPESISYIEFSVTLKDGIMHLEPGADEFAKKQLDGDQMVWQWATTIYIGINTFMLNYGEIAFEVEQKVAHAPSKQKHHHKHGKNSVRLFKCYTLKRAWRGEIRKHTEITCPAWGVRGHYRHYKNGKTIFIDAFVKGKERANYQGKEYNLIPYKDA